MDIPLVSFILATHNRAGTGPGSLGDCLRRTLACGLPAKRFSVTVVDNASTDDTPALVQSITRAHPNVCLLRLDKNYGPVAKNLALHNNPADIFVLLDDDAHPLPGAATQMLRHFHDDPHLGAAVFDVTLPDGAKEASAFPDVFIGAGTALRAKALRSLDQRSGGRGGPLLPADFFMQAEEYDLSFRLIAAGWSVQRFWDMPLMHWKSPQARIGQRTTRLDVRNNLYLLAKYLPEPLCHQMAADWLARYWLMAAQRDAQATAASADASASLPRPPALHKKAFIHGMHQGLTQWSQQRRGARLVLPEPAIERIFKFRSIRERLQRAIHKGGLRAIAFAELGKNMLAFHRAAQAAGIPVAAIIDDRLARPSETSSSDIPPSPPPPHPSRAEYRGIPIVSECEFRHMHESQGVTGVAGRVDAIIVTALSRVHAERRVAALRRTCSIPVIDLFNPRARSLLMPATAC